MDILNFQKRNCNYSGTLQRKCHEQEVTKKQKNLSHGLHGFTRMK